MSLWKIAWRSIQRRGLASSLTALSMALGVMLVVAVLLIHGLVEQSFKNKSSLGYNMIVGAKGGKLQLVLNTVYYLSQPIENIGYEYYQEFLSAEEKSAYAREIGVEQLGADRDGRYHLLVKFAIPLCLGDYYGEFRVVGTTPQLFDELVYDLERAQKYEFAAGRNFKVHSREHGYFECVLGFKVAREMNLDLGAKISAAHGDPEGWLHDEHPFTVVGILAPSGTPVDRAVFVNMEGFLLMDGHAKPIETENDEQAENDQKSLQAGPLGDDEATGPDSDGTAADGIESVAGSGNLDNPGQVAGGDTGRPAENRVAEHGEFQPLTLPEREVTSLVVRTVSPLVSMGLQNTINEAPAAQAVLPVGEIYALFREFVMPIKMVLLGLTVMICVVSGVSILVSIYNSMSDRRHEIAVMRALGAGRGTVMAVVLWESIFLSLGGGLIGWVGGHALIGLASPIIEDRTGVSISFFEMAPPLILGNLDSEIAISTEWLLIPALILLAILVGILPAMSAYRTDVSRSLSANP